MIEPRRFCPLDLRLINRETQKNYKETDHLQAHEQIIRPVFNASAEVYIYRGTAEERRYPWGDIIPGSEPVKLEDEIILKPKKGKYVFDRTQECITGHEYLWNVTCFIRGSIVFMLGNDFDFKEIFKHCYAPCLLSNPAVGHSQSAVRLCRKRTEENAVTALLTASNGVEHMDICVPAEKLEKLYTLAESLCKSYEDWKVEPVNQIINPDSEASEVRAENEQNLPQDRT